MDKKAKAFHRGFFGYVDLGAKKKDVSVGRPKTQRQPYKSATVVPASLLKAAQTYVNKICHPTDNTTKAATKMESIHKQATDDLQKALEDPKYIIETAQEEYLDKVAKNARKNRKHR